MEQDDSASGIYSKKIETVGTAKTEQQFFEGIPPKDAEEQQDILGRFQKLEGMATKALFIALQYPLIVNVENTLSGLFQEKVDLQKDSGDTSSVDKKIEFYEQCKSMRDNIVQTIMFDIAQSDSEESF